MGHTEAYNLFMLSWQQLYNGGLTYYCTFCTYYGPQYTLRDVLEKPVYLFEGT